MKVDPLDVGPDSLRKWGEQIANAINENYDECVVRHFHGKAGSSDPAPGADDSDGGPSGNGDNEPFDFPFKVTLDFDTDTATYSASIGNGELIFIFQKDDVAITGINTDLGDVSIGDLIWLNIAMFSAGFPTSATIVSGSSAGWAGTTLSFPDPVDFDVDPEAWDGTPPAPRQKHAWVLIAEIISDGAGGAKVRQCVTTNLQLLPTAYFGLTVYVPFAGFGST